MTKTLTTFLAVSAAYLMGSAAFAAEVVTAETAGMHCADCAATVKTKLMKNEAVADVAINVDTGMVMVTLKDGATLSDEDIAAIIDWAGYDLVSISRSDEA